MKNIHDIILSLPTGEVDRIFTKKQEWVYFRKRPIKSPKRVYIYDEAQRLIMGSFLWGTMISGQAMRVWEAHESHLSKKQFYDYFFDAPITHAVRIIAPFRFSDPMDISDFSLERPPSTWCWAEETWNENF